MGRQGLHAIDPCRPFPAIVLGDSSDREELGGPGVHHQALEFANCWNIATTAGSVNALLQLEDIPLDVGPGERVPSIHRCGCVRGHSMSTATRTFTIHVAVSLSAYLGAFPRALASETIPLPLGIRLTPPPQRREPEGSYSVPGCRLS